MYRPLDLDEHQFVAPPLLLRHFGLLPYRDYPYFHMPNLVGIYALLAGLSRCPLLAARLVSVFCGTATVLVLFATGWRLLAGASAPARWLVAGGIASVYLTSRLFTYTNGWAWNHDTAVLCAIVAFLVHCRGLRTGWAWCFAVAGLLLGLATGIRLSFALAVVPFALSVLLARAPAWSGRQRWLGLTAAVVGALHRLGTLSRLPRGRVARRQLHGNVATGSWGRLPCRRLHYATCFRFFSGGWCFQRRCSQKYCSGARRTTRSRALVKRCVIAATAPGWPSYSSGRIRSSTTIS